MTGYFAQVGSGIVAQVRRVSAERIADRPDLYPGEWVAVLDMSQYPAPGWSWSAEAGFTPPPEDEDAAA